MAKVLVTADSNCDIGPEMEEKYQIPLFNWKVLLEGKTFTDSVDIFPDDLYTAWRERRALPQTSASSPYEYREFFQPYLDEGYEIVHLNLGSGLSASYENCCTAAEELGNVYPVNSNNLSTGFGHLVIQAAKLAEQGDDAVTIQKKIQDMCGRAHASFLLDTLEFMAAGGRCSSVTALATTMLKIKPSIEVENTNGGKMHVGKKYHGKVENCLANYVKEKLEGRDDIDLERLFITHSGSPESDIELVRQEVAKYQDFKDIQVTRASCVISTHCGPRTLGILFMTK